MWTRNLCSKMAGFDEDNFVKAFVRALSNEAVINKLQSAVCGSLQKEVGELRDIIKGKDSKIADLESRIALLEKKQDESEQYSRRNSLRVSGIKESDSEDVVEQVINLFNDQMSISPPITAEDFDRVHRVGPKNAEKSRAILVKFSTYPARNRVFRSKKLLKPDKKATPTTGGASDTNQSKGRGTQKIFINEDLTKYRAQLLYQARTLKRQKKIEDCWSWDGSILIKNKAAKIIPVTNELDLLKASK